MYLGHGKRCLTRRGILVRPLVLGPVDWALVVWSRWRKCYNSSGKLFGNSLSSRSRGQTNIFIGVVMIPLIYGWWMRWRWEVSSNCISVGDTHPAVLQRHVHQENPKSNTTGWMNNWPQTSMYSQDSWQAWHYQQHNPLVDPTCQFDFWNPSSNPKYTEPVIVGLPHISI